MTPADLCALIEKASPGPWAEGATTWVDGGMRLRADHVASLGDPSEYGARVITTGNAPLDTAAGQRDHANVRLICTARNLLPHFAALWDAVDAWMSANDEDDRKEEAGIEMAWGALTAAARELGGDGSRE